MTNKEWQEKLEPFAQKLYDMSVGLSQQRKQLEKKIVKDFGVVEAFVSVDNDGVRILLHPTKTERVFLKLNLKE